MPPQSHTGDLEQSLIQGQGGQTYPKQKTASTSQAGREFFKGSLCPCPGSSTRWGHREVNRSSKVIGQGKDQPGAQ
jgi:hypothetical protein